MIVRPITGWLSASRHVAASCAVFVPVKLRVLSAGVTWTLTTGVITFTNDVSDFPSAVAATFVAPTALPVTVVLRA